MRVAAVLGPRQAGKSTLIAQIASRRGMPLASLDDETNLRQAVSDPVGFIADLGQPVAIDEVQRAPGLLLAIKATVDRDPQPGAFLLTGSANLLTAPRVADSLAGRMAASRSRRCLRLRSRVSRPTTSSTVCLPAIRHA